MSHKMQSLSVVLLAFSIMCIYGSDGRIDNRKAEIASRLGKNPKRVYSLPGQASQETLGFSSPMFPTAFGINLFGRVNPTDGDEFIIESDSEKSE